MCGVIEHPCETARSAGFGLFRTRPTRAACGGERLGGVDARRRRPASIRGLPFVLVAHFADTTTAVVLRGTPGEITRTVVTVPADVPPKLREALQQAGHRLLRAAVGDPHSSLPAAIQACADRARTVAAFAAALERLAAGCTEDPTDVATGMPPTTAGLEVAA